MLGFESDIRLLSSLFSPFFVFASRASVESETERSFHPPTPTMPTIWNVPWIGFSVLCCGNGLSICSETGFFSSVLSYSTVYSEHEKAVIAGLGLTYRYLWRSRPTDWSHPDVDVGTSVLPLSVLVWGTICLGIYTQTRWKPRRTTTSLCHAPWCRMLLSILPNFSFRKKKEEKEKKGSHFKFMEPPFLIIFYRLRVEGK